MTPPTNPDTEELRSVYERCDVSNNRTDNPMSFEEFSRYIQKQCDESNKKLMTEIRADAYRKARFELRAHPRGIIIDANKVKWDVFEKYFAAIVGLPDLTHQKESLEKGNI